MLDLIEGDLSSELKRELLDFLEDNPDLDTGNGLSGAELIPANFGMPNKEELKKGHEAKLISKGNLDQFCISRLEGDLSENGDRLLDKFLSENPEFVSDARLYEVCRLKADESIIFPDKHRLKKSKGRFKKLSVVFDRRNLYRTVSIAASVAVIFSAALYLTNIKYSGHSLTPNIAYKTTLPEQPLTSPPIINVEYIPVASNTLSLTANNERITKVSLEIESDDINIRDVREKTELQTLSRLQFNQEVKVESEIAGNYIQSLTLPGNYSAAFRNPSVMYQEPQLSGIKGFLARILDEDQETGRITLLDIADAGLKGINAVAGTNLNLERDYNEEGELVFMAFNSGVIQVQHRRTLIQD